MPGSSNVSIEVDGELVANVIDLDAIADFEIENFIASTAAYAG